jgi:hypothetical protein
MKHIRRKRKLKKKIREALIVALGSLIGAVAILAMLIGAAIQTSERMDAQVLAAEVDR